MSPRDYSQGGIFALMDPTVFRALSEPNRLRIVELLSERPRSVNEISTELGVGQPQSSKHLHTLLRAGLVAVHPRAQQRIYTLEPDRFNELGAWLAALERHWRERLDHLDEYLSRLQKEQQWTPKP